MNAFDHQQRQKEMHSKTVCTIVKYVKTSSLHIIVTYIQFVLDSYISLMYRNNMNHPFYVTLLPGHYAPVFVSFCELVYNILFCLYQVSKEISKLLLLLLLLLVFVFDEDQRKKDKSDVHFKQRKKQNEHLYTWSTN